MEKSNHLTIPWAGSPGGFASPPAARLTLAAEGDMSLKPSPNSRVLDTVRSLFPGRRFTYLHQDHTKIVRVTDSITDISGRSGDGLITSDPMSVLGVTVADCMPIFLWDPMTGARGLLHSGWKGTGILSVALDILIEKFTCEPENINVTLGPCIGVCCYAVPEERALLFREEFGRNAAVFKNEAWYIDLGAANQNILRKAGVHDVLTIDRCTACGGVFGSYRRQGKDKFTRMLALIGKNLEKD
jgi:hypothetical protein